MQAREQIVFRPGMRPVPSRETLFSSSSFAPLLLRLRASVLCPAKTAAPCHAFGCRCYCFRFWFGTGPGSLGPEGNGSFGRGTELMGTQGFRTGSGSVVREGTRSTNQLVGTGASTWTKAAFGVG
ncbi:unnamed protein product [Sphagnum troendelagicum]